MLEAKRNITKTENREQQRNTNKGKREVKERSVAFGQETLPKMLKVATNGNIIKKLEKSFGRCLFLMHL